MVSSVENPCSLKVRDVMSSPVHTVQMDDFLRTVRESFFSHHCHHVVVMERHKVYGVVSDRDVLRAISPFAGNDAMERSQDANTLKRRVHQIMSRSPITIGPDEFVAAASMKMIEQRVSCLPVVDEDVGLVGIVTARDILRWAVIACPLPKPQTAETANE